MAITKSLGQNIQSIDGNGLAVFVDDNDSALKLKDINGFIAPISDFISGGSGTTSCTIYISGSGTNSTIRCGLSNLANGELFECINGHKQLCVRCFF